MNGDKRQEGRAHRTDERDACPETGEQQGREDEPGDEDAAPHHAAVTAGVPTGTGAGT
jgi:hypothetical protein